AGIEQHYPTANDRKGVFQFEVVEDGALGDNILEQGAQVGDVPLAVAQLINEAVLGFNGRDMKGLIESTVGGADAQAGVEDQQGLTHRVHDVLGVGFDGLQIRLGAPPRGHVLLVQGEVLNILKRWLQFHWRQPLSWENNSYAQHSIPNDFRRLDAVAAG